MPDRAHLSEFFSDIPAAIITHFESEHIIGKDNDLVATGFMIIDEELTCLEFPRVHAVQ